MLKSFLAGPLLEVDGDSSTEDAADAVPEADTETGDEAEPQLMESSESLHAPLVALPELPPL